MPNTYAYLALAVYLEPLPPRYKREEVHRRSRWISIADGIVLQSWCREMSIQVIANRQKLL